MELPMQTYDMEFWLYTIDSSSGPHEYNTMSVNAVSREDAVLKVKKKYPLARWIKVLDVY